jgi:hypothetical protein
MLGEHFFAVGVVFLETWNLAQKVVEVSHLMI